MAHERRLFSEEFKREAVKLVGQPGASKAAIARDLGIGGSLLGRWYSESPQCSWRPVCVSSVLLGRVDQGDRSRSEDNSQQLFQEGYV